MNAAAADESRDELEGRLRWARALVGVYAAFYFVETALLPITAIAEGATHFVRYGAPIAAVFSIAMACGFTRVSSLVVWLLSVIFLNLLPAAREIQTSHMNLLLLYFFLSSFSKSIDSIFIRDLSRAVLWIYGLSYSYAGLTKLLSAEWMSGENIELFIQFSRFNPADLNFAALLKPHLKSLAWLIGLTELITLPAVIWRQSRIPMLYILVVLHIAIGFNSDIRNVSIGMIVCNFAVLQIFALADRRSHFKNLTARRTIGSD